MANYNGITLPDEEETTSKEPVVEETTTVQEQSPTQTESSSSSYNGFTIPDETSVEIIDDERETIKVEIESMDFANEYGLDVIPVVLPNNISKNKFKISQKAYSENGTMINSEILNGLDTETAKIEIIKFLSEKGIGNQKINYKLRDWGISRQRYWGCPIPILYREDGKVLPVKKEDLPIRLPDIKKFNKKEPNK